MRRTINDIRALCSFEATRADRDDVFEAGMLVQMDCDLERVTRLACHGWLDYTNHDPRYEGAQARGTLTEQGAKMLTYYTRALADVSTEDQILSDGVHPFLERADQVWETVVLAP